MKNHLPRPPNGLKSRLPCPTNDYFGQQWPSGSLPPTASVPSLPNEKIYYIILTGVGGGVLITPILLYCRWASGKRAAAISAVFILLNSIAALAGHFSATRTTFHQGCPCSLCPRLLVVPLVATWEVFIFQTSPSIGFWAQSCCSQG